MANNDEIEAEVEEPSGTLAPDAERKLQVARVLPFHNATGDHAKNTGGRARVVRRDGKTVTLPTADHLKYLAEMQEAELRFVESHDLVQATRKKANATDIIRLALIGAAQNAASLEFQRIELQKRGEDTSQHISRHTKVLKEIAALQGELRELGQQTLDPRSEGFQKVFRLWSEHIQGVVSEVMSKEQADLFWTKLMGVMENWEDQAESILR